MVKLDKNGKVRTDAYVGTFSTQCAGDMMEVESIKTMVKHMNKVRHPRTGQLRGYTYHGDVIGGMENCAAVDVYIHRYLSDAMWKMGRTKVSY